MFPTLVGMNRLLQVLFIEILNVPHAQSEELLMDILKRGEYAEVISPKKLRDEIIEKIKKMKNNYECIKN